MKVIKCYGAQCLSLKPRVIKKCYLTIDAEIPDKKQVLLFQYKSCLLHSKEAVTDPPKAQCVVRKMPKEKKFSMSVYLLKEVMYHVTTIT